MTFTDYFARWIETYKSGVVRRVTLDKYQLTRSHLERLSNGVTMENLDRQTYQRIINAYARDHARLSIRDFHNHLKAAVLDAVDEGLLTHNVTRKIVFKGVSSVQKSKSKYLSREESVKLLTVLDLERPIITGNRVNWDWLIVLCLKTGLRFSEALGLTPGDFDLRNCLLNVNKTYDYKHGFQLVEVTKNESSIRKILMDRHLTETFGHALPALPHEPIFIPTGRRVHDSVVNRRLTVLCQEACIPLISLHGLRHTHASILFHAGVSIVSISKRLGHSNTTVTQNTYLHIIKELEEKDLGLITDSMEKLK